MPVKPKIAATVVLLRERPPDLESDDNCEFEVFMGKRHSDARFMSDHHVFPGGSLEKQDFTQESKFRLVGLDKNTLKNLEDICKYPSILWIIAIREVFEETGVLIAGNKNAISNGIIKENSERLRDYQRKLQQDQISMTDILVKENLYYYANHLKYFGRFITPELSPIRFDTQFFLCKFPSNQNINLFYDELTEGLWASPKQILKMYRKKEIKLIFPQYSTLKRLKKFMTIEELFENSNDVSSHNRLDDVKFYFK
jgi:8-oxo-dGTP pyrophosphatase MutT (NUDIX family)